MNFWKTLRWIFALLFVVLVAMGVLDPEKKSTGGGANEIRFVPTIVR